jgi:hypothetical protein
MAAPHHRFRELQPIIRAAAHLHVHPALGPPVQNLLQKTAYTPCKRMSLLHTCSFVTFDSARQYAQPITFHRRIIRGVSKKFGEWYQKTKHKIQTN